MDYDAVVVGAGPAGLMAARKIASKGFSVLILEKEKDLGTRACAEAVSVSAFETAEIPPSPSLISNTINGAYVFPPDETKGVKISGGTTAGTYSTSSSSFTPWQARRSPRVPTSRCDPRSRTSRWRAGLQRA